MSEIKHTPGPFGWQPIETVPKQELVIIWITGTNSAGQRWMDGPGEMWANCYYDRICGEWRTTRPSGHLRCVPERYVTHWRPMPEVPDASIQPAASGDATNDAVIALELLAAEADAGTVMIPSGLRLTIDAALIKAGRKAAPEPVRVVTIAGVRDE
ncbi:hypothetical protein [Burkholderia cenocepacia]|uniref:hypothetical protein n=1 Tax=Burkholderia cenocepacia TaxID=95486 RepID=UPI00223165D3|nr:hypothetical protein [Burkholderia cenocepacia]MCW3678245.1 hypothetical protein [Burkholderia cenocepacia]